MCGIAGIIGRNPHPFSEKLKSLLTHRGPDNTTLSELRSASRSIQILHHRLSIIDLSPSANQPFFDESGRYALVFNGEIYNYKELKAGMENKGIHFKTHSDTEVLLRLLIQEGENAFTKLNGMFAIAFFDLKTDVMIIGRDPFGEKPFYYFLKNETFYFSSEIKFILEASQNKFSVNGRVLGQYFSSHYLDATIEETFFQGIKKIPSGTYAKVSLQNSLSPEFKSYYVSRFNPGEVVTSLSQAEEQIRELVKDSLRLRLRSDVPVGLFLSGGVDSSILASLCPDSVRFVSVVSEDPNNDESPFITMMEKHLKREAIKINIEAHANEFFELLPKIIWHNDEPLTSFSAVAYFKMIEAASANGLKVLLTGQGADEVFLGYKKFKFWHYKNELRNGKLMSFSKAIFDEGLNSDLFTSFSLSEASRYFPGRMKASKYSSWGEALLRTNLPVVRNTSTIVNAQLEDLAKYSVPVLLHIEDRLSMAFGSEVRVPFLDKRIVDLGIQLDTSLKINKGYSKFSLRSAFKGYLPEAITWRRDKKGFTIPQEKWMRNELSSHIETLFNSDMISYEMGVLKKSENLQDFSNFKSGKSRLIGYKDVFARMNFEIWMRNFSHSLSGEVC